MFLILVDGWLSQGMRAQQGQIHQTCRLTGHRLKNGDTPLLAVYGAGKRQ
ncbi:hypothetical protein Z947_1045 [Sulfitobacter geojensis]|nr:hypothetical protein Z947_1045 [Sulfitobacter geojensis]